MTRKMILISLLLAALPARADDTKCPPVKAAVLRGLVVRAALGSAAWVGEVKKSISRKVYNRHSRLVCSAFFGVSRT